MILKKVVTFICLGLYHCLGIIHTHTPTQHRILLAFILKGSGLEYKVALPHQD